MFVAMDIELVVERAGHQAVGFAGTAERAVALADELHPDLVLMDIRLRGERATVSMPLLRFATGLISPPSSLARLATPRPANGPARRGSSASSPNPSTALCWRSP